MYAWGQIIGGIVFIILPIAALMDPTANRIWLGGFILGPIWIYRGIRSLNEDAAEAEVKGTWVSGPRTQAEALESQEDFRSLHSPEPLGCVVCGAAYLYGYYRPPNPNDAPMERRLEKGKRLGMPLEDFEMLLKTESLAATLAGAGATGIQRLP